MKTSVKQIIQTVKLVNKAYTSINPVKKQEFCHINPKRLMFSSRPYQDKDNSV